MVNDVSLRSRAIRLAAKGLRGSPAPVQDVAARGSRLILRGLQQPTRIPTGEPVWVSPPPPLPEGVSLAAVEATFRSWSVNGESVGHLDGYVTDSYLRFLHTWGLVRHDTGRCLELGANPYFLTWLLEDHTDLDLSLASFHGVRGQGTETTSWLPPGASERVTRERSMELFNAEEDEFPYADGTFDLVLFCEMIEHMLMDPLATLRQIHRILRPGGVLILTTPNVARLENVLRLLHGANLYDPYSGYGPYGRHNREFTRHELHRLLEFAGFEVETSMTADGHPTDHTSWGMYDDAAPLVDFRRPDLGHYLYVRARTVRPPREGLPSFLYRSRPDGEIVDYA